MNRKKNKTQMKILNRFYLLHPVFFRRFFVWSGDINLVQICCKVFWSNTTLAVSNTCNTRGTSKPFRNDINWLLVLTNCLKTFSRKIRKLTFSYFFFSGLLKTKLVAHEDLIMSLNWNKKGDYLLSASIDKVSAS